MRSYSDFVTNVPGLTIMCEISTDSCCFKPFDSHIFEVNGGYKMEFNPDNIKAEHYYFRFTAKGAVPVISYCVSVREN